MERRDWISRINELRKNDYVPKSSEEEIKPHQAIKYISKTLGEDLIFVTDVGQHQMWTAQYCGRTHPRSFLTSGGLGTMGFESQGHAHAMNLKEVALITDGRFSGASRGASIGHISPEAAHGGEIGIIEEGDIIEIDIPNYSINLKISEEELIKRMDNFKPLEINKVSGWLDRYRRCVTSSDKGAILK